MRPSYKNGSLAREEVRNACAVAKWDKFDEFLDSTPPGNDGQIGNVAMLIEWLTCNYELRPPDRAILLPS